ncbi:Tlg2-vesicle protein [Ceratobasidium sp. 395]|nr:Tlg2-vesicle protein [Ceratobasidium sp. 395]
MATLTPHSPQPIASSSRSPSPTPTPSYITYSKSEPDYHDDHDTIPLTGRGVRRSGSPTPSEKEELKAFEGTSRKIFRKESWKDRDFLITMAVIAVLIAITVVIGVFQNKIVAALVPAAEWVKKAPAGWLIPIAILIILSIPPLIGAEIIHILCGFTYGLWIGFLITCAGMVIGESITFFLFRYWLRSRAEKMERGGSGSPRFGALARVIREGGFLVAVVIRYSAFPTHVTTALFAVSGVTFLMFLITLVLSLPRQLAGVYIGVLAKEAVEGHPSKLDQTLSTVVLVVTIIITIAAATWIQFRLKAAALAIIRERRARENAADNQEIKPFNPSALYDPEGSSNNHMNTETYFGTRTPSPSPPAVPSGAMMPAHPAPAQIHVDSSVV